MGTAPGDEDSSEPLTRKAGKIGNAGKAGWASKVGEADSAGNADKTLRNPAKSPTNALDRVTVSAKSSANGKRTWQSGELCRRCCGAFSRPRRRRRQ
ncbi:hypothetical protein OZX74_00625 [Bifidobacterium sp. ESL0798]|uniref:hypothetical protein n=1 Tax=Bifidobacterium sp. ESL0798 TaxID=2983235 RepID=UPI0023F994B9|nr:hypothetical protein [Bifidobacterium sp. ESL0798]WEV74108.1 hypothetical protein OZX74_00625 [Bifidobacterium sp. ESL0798]